MKLNTILIIFLIIPAFTFGQFNQSFDFVTGLEYSYRSLRLTLDEDIIEEVRETKNRIDSKQLNWRFGVNYNYRVTDKVVFKTGIRLASVGYKTEMEGLSWGIGQNGQEGPIPNAGSLDLQQTANQWFLQVPLVGRYEMGKRKLQPFFELGVSPALYVNTRGSIFSRSANKDVFQSSRKIDQLNEFHVIGLLSFGANYNINDNLQLFGQPAFRYHFTRLLDLMGGTENLLNYGIEVGIRRKLK